MSNTRIFKIKNSDHEDFWVIKKEEEWISAKRYIYGILSHKFFRSYRDFINLKIDYQSLTLEDIIRLPNPVKAYNLIREQFTWLVRFYEANERDWDNFIEKLNSIITENQEVTEKAFIFDTLGIIEKKECWYHGKCIVKGFDKIMKISVSDEFDNADLSQRNDFLKKTIENYRKNREVILENLLNSEKIKEEYKDYVEEFETKPVLITDIYTFEQYLDFRDIVVWDGIIHIYANVPWDEEHGIDLEFDNEGNFCFQ